MICRDAAEIISRSLDARASRVERVGLAVHTFFCRPCRRYREQLIWLHSECQVAVRKEALPGGAALPASARERIATALDKRPAD
jgi:hypothetical protein